MGWRAAGTRGTALGHLWGRALPARGVSHGGELVLPGEKGTSPAWGRAVGWTSPGLHYGGEVAVNLRVPKYVPWCTPASHGLFTFPVLKNSFMR